MRSHRTVQGLTIALALLLSTLALPASRIAGAGSDGSAVVRSAEQLRGPLTIHRLLNDRLQWALRLSRTLQSLDPVEPEQYGTQSIVDEPDPTSFKPPEDDLPGLPEPVERDDGDDGDESSNHPDEIRSMG